MRWLHFQILRLKESTTAKQEGFAPCALLSRVPCHFSLWLYDRAVNWKLGLVRL